MGEKIGALEWRRESTRLYLFVSERVHRNTGYPRSVLDRIYANECALQRPGQG